MEYLTDKLKNALSKLSDNQKEEVDVIESVFCINKENKERVKEKVLNFLRKNKEIDLTTLFNGLIFNSVITRPKERKNLLYVYESIIKYTGLKSTDLINTYGVIKSMLQIDGIIERDASTLEHVYDFGESGTIGRSIFDDDVDDLCNSYGKINNTSTCRIQISEFNFIQSEGTLLETAALFGSIKCFKFLVMNDEKISENVCKFAVMGGNIEIIHLCENEGLKFDDCLIHAVQYHRFEIFEWLNYHFTYKELKLDKCLYYFNEPIFYLYIENGTDINQCGEFGVTILHFAVSHRFVNVIDFLKNKGASLHKRVDNK